MPTDIHEYRYDQGTNLVIVLRANLLSVHAILAKPVSELQLKVVIEHLNHKLADKLLEDDPQPDEVNYQQWLASHSRQSIVNLVNASKINETNWRTEGF